MGQGIGSNGDSFHIQDIGATAYTKGDFYIKGDLVGICTDNIAANGAGTIQLEGIFTVGKTNVTIGLGARVYGTDNGSTVNTTSASRTQVGVALQAAASGADTVLVKLNSPAV